MTCSSSNQSHNHQSGARSSRRADDTESNRGRSHSSPSSRSHSTRRDSELHYSQAHESDAIRRHESRSSERSDQQFHRSSTKGSTSRETKKPEGDRAIARGDDYRSMVSNARTGGGRTAHGDETARPRRDSKAVVPQDSRTRSRSSTVKESTRREESSRRSETSSRAPSRSHSVRESSSRSESKSKDHDSARDPYDSVRTATQSTAVPASEMRNQSVRPSESHAPSTHHSNRASHHSQSSSRDPSRERSRPSQSSRSSSSRNHHDSAPISRAMSQMALVPRERSVSGASGYHSSHGSSRRESSLPPLPESRPIGSFASGSYRSGSGSGSGSGSHYDDRGVSGYGSAAYGSSALGPPGSGGGSLASYNSYGDDGRALAPYSSSYGASSSAGGAHRCRTWEEFIALDMEREQRELSGGEPGRMPSPPYPFEAEDFERALDRVGPYEKGPGLADAVREAAGERLGWFPEVGSLL